MVKTVENGQTSEAPLCFFAAAGGVRWMQTAVLAVAVLLCTAALTGVLFWPAFWEIWSVTAVLLAAVAAGLSLYYIPRFCAALCVEWTHSALQVHSGVWWRRLVRVPLPALRTFEHIVLPFGRRLDCHAMVLRFAGGTVRVLPLSGPTAAVLVQKLTEESV